MAITPSPPRRLWAVMKNSLLREANRSRVRLNQWLLCRRARRTGELHIVPTNPWRGRGSVEHYYHFMVDLLLPLQGVLSRCPPGVRVAVEAKGPFQARLAEIFGGQVDSAKTPSQDAQPLVGMNPRHVRLTPHEIQVFRQSMLQACGRPSEAQRLKRVLLIERGAPEGYFLGEADKSGGGALRRSITNHDELQRFLKQVARPQCEVVNVRLEQFTQAEQIHLFHSAAVVIGQHGAGLVNTIWMQSGGYVVEITHEQHKDHFSRLSRLCGHTHFGYYVAEAHAEVPLKSFGRWLASTTALTEFFEGV